MNITQPHTSSFKQHSHCESSTNNSFSTTYNDKPLHCSIVKPKSKRIPSIHEHFIKLKTELNLNEHLRKTQIDSLLKKCKSKLFKSIHNSINKCIHNGLTRLPQQFITNIKIEINKYYLQQSILTIYADNKVFTSISELNVVKGMEKYLKTFLNMKLIEVFEYYIHSKQYLHDYNRIYKREGEKFAMLFHFIAHVFVDYYTLSKGNRPKRRRKHNEHVKIFHIHKETTYKYTLSE